MDDTSTRTTDPIVLAVMNPIRGSALVQQIEEQGVQVVAAPGREEARAILQGGPPVTIVLTDETLPDGDWRDILRDVAASGVPAEIVVCTTGPEQPLTLSFELLDHGAFGLMAEPYDPDQLQWLINTATSRSKTLATRKASPAVPAGSADRAVNLAQHLVGSL
jgi:DNA-binding NtrC family response regulator